MLNTQAGESIEGLGDNFRVVPVSKWSELTRLTVPYQTPHPFRTIITQRPIFMDALEHAKDAFLKAGAVLPIDIYEDQILVQEYPDLPAVAFVFQRRIGREWQYVIRKYDLSPSSIAWLKATGRWSDITHH